MESRILIPIRYSAWLSGDLGNGIETTLQHGLRGAQLTRLPRGFLVQADEEPGPFLEQVHRAMTDVEAGIQQRYPMFHREMGPAWTGTLQVLFPESNHPTT